MTISKQTRTFNDRKASRTLFKFLGTTVLQFFIFNKEDLNYPSEERAQNIEKRLLKEPYLKEIFSDEGAASALRKGLLRLYGQERLLDEPKSNLATTTGSSHSTSDLLSSSALSFRKSIQMFDDEIHKLLSALFKGTSARILPYPAEKGKSRVSFFVKKNEVETTLVKVSESLKSKKIFEGPLGVSFVIDDKTAQGEVFIPAFPQYYL